jgi:hypothetical protein
MYVSFNRHHISGLPIAGSLKIQIMVSGMLHQIFQLVYVNIFCVSFVTLHMLLDLRMLMHFILDKLLYILEYKTIFLTFIFH